MDQETERSIKSEAAITSVEVGSATAGALVGFVLGGPIGAAVGAAAPPLVTRSAQVVIRAVERRKARAEKVLAEALVRSSIPAEELVSRLDADDALADHFTLLIQLAADSDPEVGEVLSYIMAETLGARDASDLDRLMLLTDEIKGLRAIHLRIVRFLGANDRRASADEIAQHLHIPRVELRGAVRELELRGVIRDAGTKPVVWELREFGLGLAAFLARG
ncbi:hypothetical protein ACW4FP_19890 (plasmid) [Paenarthrobacter ureafaciens]